MEEKARIELPSYVAAVIHKLEQAGFEAYAVGGCVRDSLLNMVPNDWDVTTNALPQEVCASLPDLRVAETGVQHGTVTVICDRSPVEVTTYRTEGNYTDHRHPDEVRFVRCLDEDLKRRDFTVNAMAYHPDRGIVDPFGGREDLKARCLKTVGKAEERFREDALRILRALRFSAVYGFEIEGGTSDAIYLQRALLHAVSAERIAAELRRLMTGQSAAKILRQYLDVIGIVIPELLPMRNFDQHTRYHHLDVWEHTLAAVDAVKPEQALRLAALLHDVGKPKTFTLDEAGVGHFYQHAAAGAEMAVTILRRLKFDRETITRVRELVLRHGDEIVCTDRAVKRWLGRTSPEFFRQLIEVKRADAAGQPDWIQKERLPLYDEIIKMTDRIIKEGMCFSVRDLKLKGSDLLQAGVKAGPEIGAALQTLTDAVIDGRVENERDALLEYYFS